MKLDLHVHSSERSACSIASADELIQAAIAAGLDGLAFTDHDRLLPPDVQAALNEKWAPFRVFSGIEVSIPHEHCLVYGVHDPSLESGAWTWETLQPFVKAAGGFIAIAHPFRYSPLIRADLSAYLPDALEMASNNIEPRNRRRIEESAAALGASLLSDSDSHSIPMMGAYHNEFPAPIASDEELLSALLSRSFTPIFPKVGRG